MFETGLELHAVLEHQKIAGIPLLILANKQDLVTAMNADEVFLCSNSDYN
jgi:ADP-ribosylation factor-like protein 3